MDKRILARARHEERYLLLILLLLSTFILWSQFVGPTAIAVQELAPPSSLIDACNSPNSALQDI